MPIFSSHHVAFYHSVEYMLSLNECYDLEVEKNPGWKQKYVFCDTPARETKHLVCHVAKLTKVAL